MQQVLNGIAIVNAVQQIKALNYLNDLPRLSTHFPSKWKRGFQLYIMERDRCKPKSHISNVEHTNEVIHCLPSSIVRLLTKPIEMKEDNI